VATSQCDAVRARRAVLHSLAVMVRLARCEKSSSLSSTCWSPLRSSFAPAVFRNHSITPTRAPADVRDASHPAPIRRAPEGLADPTAGE